MFWTLFTPLCLLYFRLSDSKSTPPAWNPPKTNTAPYEPPRQPIEPPRPQPLTPEPWDPIIDPQRPVKEPPPVFLPSKFVPGPKDVDKSVPEPMKVGGFKPVEFAPKSPDRKPPQQPQTGPPPELAGDSYLPHRFELPKLKATKRPAYPALNDRCELY